MVMGFQLLTLIIRAISVFTDIRVSEDVESEGVDINEHNEQGYSF